MGSPFLPNWPYDLTILKNTPALGLFGQEVGAQYHDVREISGNFWIAKNAIYSGGQWVQKNLTIASWALEFTGTGQLNLYQAPAGTSPITWILQGTYQTTAASGTGSFNVVNFGADKTGASDSSAAINACISQAPIGSQIVFPAGIYLCNAASIAARNDLQFLAIGQVIITGTASPLVGVLSNTPTPTFALGFYGFTFLPTGTNPALSIVYNTWNPTNAPQGPTIEKCIFIGPSGGTSQLIQMTYGANATFLNCSFIGSVNGVAANTGLLLTGVSNCEFIGCDFLWFSNNAVVPVAGAPSTNVSQYIIFSDCYFSNNSVSSIGSNSVNSMEFHGCYFLNNSSFPIIADQASSNVITKGCYFAMANVGGREVLLFNSTGAPGFGIQVEGCTFVLTGAFSVGGSVLAVTGNAGNIVAGILFKNNTIVGTGLSVQPANVVFLTFCSTAEISDNALVGVTPTNLFLNSSSSGATTALNAISQRRNVGWNPQGNIASPPAVAATTVFVYNNTGYDCLVQANNAAISTSMQLKGANGTSTTIVAATTSPLPPVFVPSGASIALTYASGSPTWVWSAL